MNASTRSRSAKSDVLGARMSWRIELRGLGRGVDHAATDAFVARVFVTGVVVDDDTNEVVSVEGFGFGLHVRWSPQPTYLVSPIQTLPSVVGQSGTAW